MRLCFNSRAHGGRDYQQGVNRLFAVFQFTRPRGARRFFGHIRNANTMFQFTRPRGARPPQGSSCVILTSVSIHAPTGGATVNLAGAYTPGEFQFTRPRGARLETALMDRRR